MSSHIPCVPLVVLFACTGASTTDRSNTDSLVTVPTGVPTGDSSSPTTTTPTVSTTPTKPDCADPTLRDTLGPFQRYEAATLDPAEEWWTWGTGLFVADFDQDGTDEIYIAGENRVHGFVLDEGKGALIPVETGLPAGESRRNQNGGGSGGAVADYDGDGDLDLYLTRVTGWPRTNHAHAGVNRLYRNDGKGVFTDVTYDAGRVNGCLGGECYRSNTASFGDVDGDGDLDLFVGSHGPIIPGSPEYGEPAFLYLNNGDGTFSDARALLGEEADQGLTLAGGFFDLDRDGALDIYLANDVGGRAMPNLILWNRGGRGDRWEPDVDSGLGISIDSMGLAAGDLNGDLLPDFGVPAFGIVSLLLSNESLGVWIESADARGVTLLNSMEVGWGTAFADLDNDGDLDMLTQHGPINDSGAPYEPDALHVNVGTPNDPQFALDQFDSFGLADRANQRGVATVDLNRDGWLDVVKASVDGEVSVQIARCGTGAWLAFELEQPGTKNPNAVGAEVLVTHGGHTWIRTVRAGGTSFGVAMSPELHFGLGAVERVDQVVVRWPDGATSDLGAVDTRQRLVVAR